MLLEKANKLFSNKFILIGAFIALFLLTRVPYLGPDAINPDGVNWHYRSEQFVVGLKNGLWEKTYQHYHPGVTLMWIMGPAVEIARQINPALRVYDHGNFLFLHTVAKYSLVFVQLILTLFLLAVFSRILDFKQAFLVVLLFTLEPFFIGNSRMLHMDVLLTLFLSIGLGFGYLSIQSDQSHGLDLVLSGVFLGLAFLTKSIAIGGILFAGGMLFLKHYKEPRKAVKPFFILMGVFLLTIFVLFPAMWTKPFHTIYRIFDEAERIGIRKGHGQVFFGTYTRDPGIFFYPVVLFLKISPILLVGLIFFVVNIFKNKINLKNLSFPGYLTIFYLGYMVVMTISTKKIDRYLVPLFPYLALLAVLSFTQIRSLKKRAWVLLVSIFLLLGLSFAFYPFQFTYFNPLVLSAENAHGIIAQKPFGIGIPDLKRLILNKYGDYPALGFYDIKPMKAIYKSSQIADVQVNGVSDYDYLILGPNEEIPGKVLEAKEEFVLDEVIHINGLEYWKVYAKDSISE